MSYIIDSHCHLNDSAYDFDRDYVVKKMLESNVKRIMLVSSFIKDYEYGLTFNYEGLRIDRSLGIYPGDVNELTESDLEKYFEYYKRDDLLAIGEIGLDYHYGKDNKERQIYFFKKQLEYASILNKPVIIHSRDASQDTYDILKEYKVKGILHCYSGSLEMAKEFIKLGYYISFAGPITFKNSNNLENVAKNIDLNYLLIETDSPYLTPVPNRGKRNDPSNVKYVLEKVALIKELDIDSLQKQIKENYERLFYN